MQGEMKFEGLETRKLMTADVLVDAEVPDARTSTDDVIVDGNTITAENYDATGDDDDGVDDIILVDILGPTARDGGEEEDTVQVNGSNTAGQSQDDGDDIPPDIIWHIDSASLDSDHVDSVDAVFAGNADMNETRKGDDGDDIEDEIIWDVMGGTTNL